MNERNCLFTKNYFAIITNMKNIQNDRKYYIWKNMNDYLSFFYLFLIEVRRVHCAEGAL